MISEPWDFDVLGRGNLLSGEIVGVCFGPDKKNWQGKYVLVRVDAPFEWKDTLITELIISPRHDGFSIEDIFNGKEVNVDISYAVRGTKIEVNRPFKPCDVKYAFIGFISLVKNEPTRKFKIL